MKQKLQENNKKLCGEKEMNSFIVEEKVIHAKKLEKQVKEVNKKSKKLCVLFPVLDY